MQNINCGWQVGGAFISSALALLAGTSPCIWAGLMCDWTRD